MLLPTEKLNEAVQNSTALSLGKEKKMMGLRVVYQKQFSCKISFSAQASRENFLEPNNIFKKPESGEFGTWSDWGRGNRDISVGGKHWESSCVWRKRALVKLGVELWGRQFIHRKERLPITSDSDRKCEMLLLFC